MERSKKAGLLERICVARPTRGYPDLNIALETLPWRGVTLGNVRHRTPDRNAPPRQDVFIAYERGRNVRPTGAGPTLERPRQRLRARALARVFARPRGRILSPSLGT